MGQFYEKIPTFLIKWILDQKIFWVATATLSQKGHINVSPKGGQYFGVLDPVTFWYLDLSGSGVETISHLHQEGNGRITILLNAFEGQPQIVRLWGKGEVLEYGSDKFKAFVEENKVNAIAGSRAIIIVHIHQVGTSCGFSVPYYDFKAFRTTLNDFSVKKVAAEESGNKKDGIEQYWAFKSAQSMDGLPGMHRAIATATRDSVKPMKKMVGPLALSLKVPLSPVKIPWQVPTINLVSLALLSFCMGIVATALAGMQLGYL